MFKRILMLGPAALLAAACGSERPHPTDPTLAFSVETRAVRENRTVEWNAIARAQTLTHAMSQQAGRSFGGSCGACEAVASPQNA